MVLSEVSGVAQGGEDCARLEEVAVLERAECKVSDAGGVADAEQERTQLR